MASRFDWANDIAAPLHVRCSRVVHRVSESSAHCNTFLVSLLVIGITPNFDRLYLHSWKDVCKKPQHAATAVRFSVWKWMGATQNQKLQNWHFFSSRLICMGAQPKQRCLRGVYLTRFSLCEWVEIWDLGPLKDALSDRLVIFSINYHQQITKKSTFFLACFQL